MMYSTVKQLALDANLAGLKTIASTKRLVSDGIKATFNPTVIPSLMVSYQLLLLDQLRSIWVMSKGIPPKYRF